MYKIAGAYLQPLVTANKGAINKVRQGLKSVATMPTDQSAGLVWTVEYVLRKTYLCTQTSEKCVEVLGK